jgi:hypothetical protein
MGGGGDVVGALGTAVLCQALGKETALGGVPWERTPIDPHPGPRPAAQIVGGRRVGPTAVLADPQTATPEGIAFSESRMAGFLGREVALIDVSEGPAAAADGIEAAARELGCDLVVLIDVGGDVLAHGGEEGLASPLCDAITLAAAAGLPGELPAIAAVYGPGCDGELSPWEVLDRIVELGREDALLGAWGLNPASCELVEAAAEVVPTEASLQAVRCARGESGSTTIRGGRRSVELTPVGGVIFFFDPVIAVERTAPLARAVRETAGIEEARAALAALGVLTELDLERARARGEEAGFE